MSQLMIIGILLLISIMLIVYSLWPKGDVDRDVLKRRMMGKRGLDEVKQLQDQAKESATQKMLEKVAPIAIKPVMPKDDEEISVLRMKLASAGFRRENASTLYLASRTILGLLGGAVGLLWTLGVGSTQSDVALWSVASGGIGFWLPSYWLSMATRKRGDKIKRGLPDAMDLMVISVESGLALDSAILRVGEEMLQVHPELAEEMQIVSHESQMGLPRSEALDNMATRINIPEVKSLVAVITQAEKFGTSVAKALRNQAETLRVKRRQAAEEQAQKTTVKLMLPLILFIFPAIFVVLVGPAALKIMGAFGDME